MLGVSGRSSPSAISSDDSISVYETSSLTMQATASGGPTTASRAEEASSFTRRTHTSQTHSAPRRPFVSGGSANTTIDEQYVIASSIEVMDLREQVKLMKEQVVDAQEDARASRLLCQQLRSELQELIRTEAAKGTSETYGGVASLLSSTSNLVEKFVLFEKYIKQQLNQELAERDRVVMTATEERTAESGREISDDVRRVLQTFRGEIVQLRHDLDASSAAKKSSSDENKQLLREVEQKISAAQQEERVARIQHVDARDVQLQGAIEEQIRALRDDMQRANQATSEDTVRRSSDAMRAAMASITEHSQKQRNTLEAAIGSLHDQLPRTYTQDIQRIEADQNALRSTLRNLSNQLAEVQATQSAALRASNPASNEATTAVNTQREQRLANLEADVHQIQDKLMASDALRRRTDETLLRVSKDLEATTEATLTARRVADECATQVGTDFARIKTANLENTKRMIDEKVASAVQSLSADVQATVRAGHGRQNDSALAVVRAEVEPLDMRLTEALQQLSRRVTACEGAASSVAEDLTAMTRHIRTHATTVADVQEHLSGLKASVETQRVDLQRHRTHSASTMEELTSAHAAAMREQQTERSTGFAALALRMERNDEATQRLQSEWKESEKKFSAVLSESQGALKENWQRTEQAIRNALDVRADGTEAELRRYVDMRMEDATATRSSAVIRSLADANKSHRDALRRMGRAVFSFVCAPHRHGTASSGTVAGTFALTSSGAPTRAVLRRRFFDVWLQYARGQCAKQSANRLQSMASQQEKLRQSCDMILEEQTIMRARLDMVLGEEMSAFQIDDDENQLLSENPKAAAVTALQNLLSGNGSLLAVLRALIAFIHHTDADQRRQDRDAAVLADWVKIIDEEIRKVQRFIRPPFK